MLFLALSTPLFALPDPPPPAAFLRVAIAQIGIVSRSQDNLQKILHYIDRAADEKCRVVVFPEGALRELKAPDDPDTLAALSSVSQAAARRQIYVMLSVFSVPEASRPGFNWMVVVDPNGREIFHYTKLYDRHESDLPRVFYIDGIPCSAIICADRWLRAVEDLPVMDGARVSFELSDNFESEWVPELGWYWYVARARRNNIYVVFANSATAPPDVNDRHGHSAVIDPQGELATATCDASEEMVVGTLDVSCATRAEAERRKNDPVFRELWNVAARVRDREPPAIPAWKRYESPEIPVTIAAAQIAASSGRGRNLERMEKMIREAAERGANVVAFPELSLNREESLRTIRKAARKRRVYVIFATPAEGDEQNSAYVIGPDGQVLTRYDRPGGCPARMWFKVKGVPALVTIGNEVLWNEISETAAFAGAQLLFNLSSGKVSSDDFAVQAAFASFRTLTTFVMPAGAGPSSIWDDLQADEEIRAAVNHAQVSAKDGTPAIYASFAANCIVKAGPGEEIIYATRKVNHQNPFREDTKNPQMRPWYSFGAETITGCKTE